MTGGEKIRAALGPALNNIVRHSGACPDCDSDLRAVEVQPRVYVATVFHDDTCPRYRAMPKRSNQ